VSKAWLDANAELTAAAMAHAQVSAAGTVLALPAAQGRPRAPLVLCSSCQAACGMRKRCRLGTRCCAASTHAAFMARLAS